MSQENVSVRQPSDEEIKAYQTWPIWQKEQSSFDWFYEEKETCYIIEGSAQVYDESGELLAQFKKGDLVEFPKGLKCTWKITEDVKKHYNFG